MSSLFEHAVPVEKFSFSRDKHLSSITGEAFPIKGYVYLLVCVSVEGIIAKIGQTLNLEKCMGNYASRGSRYSFAKAQEYGGANKEEVQEIILAKEQEILRKMRARKQVKILHGKEHFQIDPSIIPDLERIFASQTREIKKVQVAPFKKVYFKESVFPEQIQGGRDIFEAFENGKHLVNLRSRTQSGKTGAVMSAISFLAESHWERDEPIPKMIVATPLNDREWKTQTQDRIPFSILKEYAQTKPLLENESVKILADLLKLVRNLEEINEKHYIFIDEYQRGTQKNQTVDKFFKEVIKLNTDLFGQSPEKFYELLEKKQIYFCFISATDFYMSTLSEMDQYEQFFTNIDLGVSKSYIKWEDYFESGNIRDMVKVYDDRSHDLTTNFESILSTFLLDPNPNRYILIRKDQKLNIEFLKSIIREKFGETADVLEHHGSSKLDSGILKIKPSKPTIIILKDYWRAAKTICAENIGLVFDRYLSSPHLQSVDTVLQGLLGRITGYKPKNDIVIYTNKEVLTAFLEQRQSVLDQKTVQTGKDNAERKVVDKTNFVFSIPEDILENFTDKDLRAWLRYKKEFTQLDCTIRSIPLQKSRIKSMGFADYKSVDPEFFKDGNAATFPNDKFASGGFDDDKSVCLWVNYDSESPGLVKVTMVVTELVEESQVVVKKQGVLSAS